LGATAGTVLTPANVNMLSPANASNISVNAGCNALAASSAVRTICGFRNLRPGLSTTVGNVLGDLIWINFGGVEANASGQVSITAGVPNLIPSSMPPCIIGPGQSALLYLWYPVLSAPSAAAYAVEVGFWVR
jgi:hypothetical protein